MTYVPPPIVEPEEVPAFTRESSFDPNRYLYHYTTWERLLDIAHSRSFRLSSATRMNDPRESKRWFFSHSSGPESPPDAAAGLWEAAREFRSHVNVAAFATDLPGKDNVRFGAGYARPRMWAQYSANHTGACLIVDRTELLRRFVEEYAEKEPSAHFTSHHVRYLRMDPLKASVSLGGTNTPDLSAIVSEFFVNNWMDAFYVKHEDWRDEREFRLAVFEPGHTGECYIDLRGAVAGLVLGVDFSDEHLAVARIFNDALDVRGRVARIDWNLLSHRLLPAAEQEGNWMISRSTAAVVVNLRWDIPRPNAP